MKLIFQVQNTAAAKTIVQLQDEFLQNRFIAEENNSNNAQQF